MSFGAEGGTLDATLLTILAGGLLMSLFAVVGGLFLFVPELRLRAWLKPMVAFAAGSLIGGAFFHMLPQALEHSGDTDAVLLWVVAGFVAFFALDQLLEWHHRQRPASQHVRPLGPLLLVADGLHNFLGGLATGAIFMMDARAGVAAWVAAALHEIPQEIGDFAAIVHAGYSRKRALLYNFLSALTFPVGGLVAYVVGRSADVRVFVALGAGSFMYIAASDLIPEVKRAERFSQVLTRFVFFFAGVALLYSAHGLHG